MDALDTNIESPRGINIESNNRPYTPQLFEYPHFLISSQLDNIFQMVKISVNYRYSSQIILAQCK